ncbi:type VII secretion protein EccB [Streptomyces sp. NPDC007084]|uniref:type VII secretion protein EccB n=1 Tax=Streptomyces sp. NPDC007084 TaxID=3154313 RepID=UPI0034531F3F
MDSKRDQVQAHMFMMGRLTSGMLRADPDSAESPQGRTNRGIVIGIVIAVIVAAGAFVIGLISPGTKGGWREDGTLVVNKDTGSRYLYLSGRLRPLRNYTSAKLLLGKDAKTVSVGTKSLAGTPHGAPVGIPGAPDTLAGSGDLVSAPWELCSTPGDDSGWVSTLAVGHTASGTPLTKRQGLLVKGPDADRYLLWSGSKLQLDTERGAAESLGYGSVAPLPVSASFLSSLPAGPVLTPRPVDGLGEPGPSLGGRPTRLGQMFKVAVTGARTQMYVLTGKGLVPVTRTEVALALGDPKTRELAYQGARPTVTDVGAEVLGDHLAPVDAQADTGVGLPATPPEPVHPAADQGLCARFSAATSGRKGPSTSIALAGTQDLGITAQPATDFLSAPCLPVDRITAAPGKAALVRALSAAGGDLGSTLYLVTDEGAKYRVADAEAASALGLDPSAAQELPSMLLAMLPTGPDLSPKAAENGKAANTAARCGKTNDADSAKDAEPEAPSASASPPEKD